MFHLQGTYPRVVYYIVMGSLSLINYSSSERQTVDTPHIAPLGENVAELYKIQ